ncbi:hypothetical protein N3K66_006979 [Trichothecium roseum]|uniref:Uncharacterized protein n=1 Tax=Trichothecium roseum TaxID=47278 RepID=A0ACC0UX18_9HYPO|nr:hypothetical protein N3K66_006979 [Trichothecium roseum]
MRALWEQGFYGKGNLSRSEPHWLQREQTRRGLLESHVSELHTDQRRVERAQAKWERARQEQEAIRQTREEEAKRAEMFRHALLAADIPSKKVPVPLSKSPVGPLELLALPNASIERPPLDHIKPAHVHAAPTGPLELLAMPNSAVELGSHNGGDGASRDTRPPPIVVPDVAGEMKASVHMNGFTSDAEQNTSSASSGSATPQRRKSVRFSPKVESTTFQLGDPPSPNYSPISSSPPLPGNGGLKDSQRRATERQPLVNKEHLQLMPEEALWLTFALGVLKVTDPLSGLELSSPELFKLFRQHSYFPPRNGPDDPDLQPDDGFLVHYAVYHHFRSLGWVPRSGIKFGVDWLLYTRGPVFDHAQFGLIVIPSYTDSWWKANGKRNPQKTWQWLHGIVRVLSHVMKNLVFVYVDVPPPTKFEAGLSNGLTEALKLYKIKEIMVKRWSSNRNRG